jgi:Lrp/AsnC family transcriptional regulator of ectoine degradation
MRRDGFDVGALGFLGIELDEGGGIDYLIQFMVKDVDAYQRLVDRLLEMGIGLKRYYTYIVTKAIKEDGPAPLTGLDAH